MEYLCTVYGVLVSDIDLMRPSLFSRFVTVDAIFSNHFHLFLIYEKLLTFILPGYRIILINLSEVLILKSSIVINKFTEQFKLNN